MRNRRRRFVRNLRWRQLTVPPRVRRGTTAALCGIGLAGSIWYGMPWAWEKIKAHSYFGLRTIEVAGNRRLRRQEVLAWAGVSEGSSVWDAAPAMVRLRIEGNPWIEHVVVQRELPRRLSIRVRERTPAAIVRLDGLHYVDRSGHVLGPLRDDDSRDLPIITGLDPADITGLRAVALHRALQLLRWCERLRCFDTVSEVHVDPVHGITVFPLRRTVAVVLGWGSWRDKLTRSARVFAAWEGQAARLTVVDVSFRDIVVVKLREESHTGGGRGTRRGMRV